MKVRVDVRRTAEPRTDAGGDWGTHWIQYHRRSLHPVRRR